MIDTIILDSLETKVIDLLESYKDPLVQVLRFWEEGRFVPREIEDPVKHIIKNFSIAEDKNYTYQSPEFSIQKENDIFLISTEPQGSPYEVQIHRKEAPATKYGSYRTIHYQGAIYEELDLSGNTYNHILSQSEKVKEWIERDIEAGLLSPEEGRKLIIRNYFHDIPEYKKGDVICSSKTDEHRKHEDIVAEEILALQDWTDEEKEYMKSLTSLHTKKSLFKLYEILFILLDIHTMIEHKDKHNDSCYLAGSALGFHLPRLIIEYELPSGKKMYGLDIPSCANHLREQQVFIDSAFAYVDEHGIADVWKERYEEGKHARNGIIKPYITK